MNVSIAPTLKRNYCKRITVALITPALFVITLFVSTVFTASSAFAADAASAVLKFTNDSTQALKVTVIHGDKTYPKTKRIGPNKTITFQFHFGSCNKTKEREYDVNQLNGVGVAFGVVTIVAERVNGKCKATLTFNQRSGGRSPLKPSVDKETGRIGVITITG